MKFSLRLLAPAFAVVAALSLSSCSPSDTHEKVLNDAAAQFDKMAATVASVTDKASAEKAAKELPAIAGELKKIANRAASLGQPAVDIKARVDLKMRDVQAKFAEKMEAQKARVKALPAEVTQAFAESAQAVGPAMDEVVKAFTAADKK